MTMLDDKPKRIVDEEEFAPASPAPASASDKTLTLTEAQLKALIADAIQQAGAGGILPPTAYRTETGEVFRDVLEPTGRWRKNKVTGRQEAINRVVQKRVHIVADPSPEGLRNAYRACRENGLHWFHPGLGWFRGSKREVERPDNLGDGAALFEMQFEEMPNEEDWGTSTVTMQGVPANDANDDTNGGAAEAPADQPEPAAPARGRKAS